MQTTSGTSQKITYSPLEPLPGLEKAGEINFATFLGVIFKLLITAGALLAVGTLVYAGISYILSEAFETKGEAKRRMQAALWGLIILLGAWLMLNTINPTLLTFDLSSIGKIGSGAGDSNQSQAATSQTTAQIPTESEVNTCTHTPNSTIQIQPDGSFRCVQNQ